MTDKEVRTKEGNREGCIKISYFHKLNPKYTLHVPVSMVITGHV